MKVENMLIVFLKHKGEDDAHIECASIERAEGVGKVKLISQDGDIIKTVALDDIWSVKPEKRMY